MAWDQVKVVLECIQICVQILAVVLVGSWAVAGLFLFRQRDRANAEIRKLDLESRQIDLATRRSAALCLEMAVEAAAVGGTRMHMLFVTVTMRNVGTRNTRIGWEREPDALVIRRVELAGDKGVEFRDYARQRVRMTSDPSRDAVAHVVRAGATEVLSFAFGVESPGVYHVAFRGALSEDEHDVARESGVRSGAAWTVGRYVTVSSVA